MKPLDGKHLTAVIGTLLVSLTFAMGSMWQIEEIWRSLQNGWPYGLPFNNYTHNYWFAHDIWFVVWAVAYALPVCLVIWLTTKMVKTDVQR